MNREIKFRAWFVSEKRMHSVNTISFNEGWVDTNKYNGSIEDFILMQYTGLKDKNGKEIYEGDIVKTGNGRLWIVSFGNYQYYQDTPAVGFYLWSKLSVFPLYGRIEIIGNVHENPELFNNDK